MFKTPLQIRVWVQSLLRGTVPALLAMFMGLAGTSAWGAKPAAHHHAAPHHNVPHARQSSSHHHRGGYHRGGYHRINVYNVGYYRGYRRSGYYRHRGYGRNSQMAWMARMYQQQYQLMAKQRQAEMKAFMAAFDTNHNGIIDGKEHGPAEKYLRERRLGMIPPLTLASNNRGKK